MAKAALVDYLDGKAVDYVEQALEYFTWLVLFLFTVYFLSFIIKPNLENYFMFILLDIAVIIQNIKERITD